MKWIFLSAFVAFILWKLPWIFLIAIIVLTAAYALKRLSPKSAEITAEYDGKPYKPFENWHKTAFKKDFEKDPEWQERSERIKAHVGQARKSAEQEMIEEQEREIRDLKRELKQSK